MCLSCFAFLFTDTSDDIKLIHNQFFAQAEWLKGYLQFLSSEVTLHFRPLIFNGIPMLLIRLHVFFSELSRGAGLGVKKNY